MQDANFGTSLSVLLKGVHLIGICLIMEVSLYVLKCSRQSVGLKEIYTNVDNLTFNRCSKSTVSIGINHKYW